MRKPAAAIILTLAAVAWAGWLPSSAQLARSGAGGPLTPVLAATYHAGSLVCHQLPDRSFHIGGVQLPVCARCTGLYAGAALGALLGLLWWRRAGGSGSRADSRLRWMRWMLIGSALPTALLWIAEHVGNVPVGDGHFGNLTRFAGSVPLGAAVAACVIAWVAGVAFDALQAGTAIH